MLQGSSASWPDIIRTMTRGKINRIDVGALLRYFEPLSKWLQRQNQMEPVIGWITSHEDTGKNYSYNAEKIAYAT